MMSLPHVLCTVTDCARLPGALKSECPVVLPTDRAPWRKRQTSSRTQGWLQPTAARRGWERAQPTHSSTPVGDPAGRVQTPHPRSGEMTDVCRSKPLRLWLFVTLLRKRAQPHFSWWKSLQGAHRRVSRPQLFPDGPVRGGRVAPDCTWEGHVPLRKSQQHVLLVLISSPVVT